jgi:hypothetical protein
VDPAGDVLAGGLIENADTGGDFIVVKLAGADGAERWRQVMNGGAGGSDIGVVGIAVDPSGDIIAAGSMQNNSADPAAFTVIKFAGADGAEQWHGGGGLGQPPAVAIEPSGDVVAPGFTDNTETGLDFTVLKLSGHDGNQMWRTDLNGERPQSSDYANAVALTSGGDIVAVGAVNHVTGPSFESSDFLVAKFDGTSGAPLWQQTIHGTLTGGLNIANGVGVDAEGNVIVAGVLQNVTASTTFAVVKLDGANGAELWRQLIGGFDETALTLTPGGDAVVTGTSSNINIRGTAFTMLKVAGADGGILWRQDLYGAPDLRNESPIDDDLVRFAVGGQRCLPFGRHTALSTTRPPLCQARRCLASKLDRRRPNDRRLSARPRDGRPGCAIRDSLLVDLLGQVVLLADLFEQFELRLDPVDVLLLGDQDLLQQLARPVVTDRDCLGDRPIEPGDSVQFELMVEPQLLGHGLADLHLAEPLHVRHPLEVEDALDEFIGVFHFADGLLAVHGGEALVAPAGAHLGVDEVLVDAGQLGGQDVVERFDQFRISLHARSS